MKKSFLPIAAALLSVSAAAAQEVPKMEAFLGYEFVRFNPNDSLGVVPSFNSNGGGGQFVYNFNKWIGLAFDAGAVNKGTLNQLDIDTTVVNFVAGPRFTFRNHSRFQPFVQALFGGAYATTSAPVNVLPDFGTIFPPGVIVNPNQPITARITASQTGFAMLAGGGLDIKLSRHIAIRPIGADYYLTRVSHLNDNKSNWNNFRYSAGINFLFGAKK